MLEVEAQSEETGYTGCSWGRRDFKGCLRDLKDYSFMTTEILKLRVMVKDGSEVSDLQITRISKVFDEGICLYCFLLNMFYSFILSNIEPMGATVKCG